MTTNAQHKANERKRKREADLVPVEVWIHRTRKAEFVKAIRRFLKPKKL